MLRVNVLVHTFTPGLRHDLRVWCAALKSADAWVATTQFDPGLLQRGLRAFRRLRLALASRPPYDVNLFVEDVRSDWFTAARVNCLIPHQEWFRPTIQPHLSRIDWVLCKTQYAKGLFDALGHRTRYIGFTSEDSRVDGARPEDLAVYHMGGTSLQKGSATVLRLWERHPEWPPLYIIWHAQDVPRPRAKNIHLYNTFVPARTVRELQNRCEIHLCPSEAEGFGHYLMEGMSCEALVITTDAPPMNELVRPDRGVLVPYARSSPQGLGSNYYVDEARLEEAIDVVLRMPTAQRRGLAMEGRRYYLREREEFPVRLRALLEEIAEQQS